MGAIKSYYHEEICQMDDEIHNDPRADMPNPEEESARNAETHEKFKRLHAESGKAVMAVYNHLKSKGYEVGIRASTMAANPDEWEAHSDGGDIDILIDSCIRILEVKQVRQADFTCKNDFPWPDVVVENVPRTDRREQKGDWPICWYAVDKDCSHAAVISPETKDSWVQKTAHAPDGVTRKTWNCPKGLVKFIKLEKIL